MGNKQSSSTNSDLLAKKDLLETNVVSLNVLIKLEYQKTPVNIEKIREYKESLAKLTKQLERMNNTLSKQ